MDGLEPHSSYTLFSTILLLGDFFIRIGLALRVIMSKKPYGVSLAWLVVILLIPFVGGGFYLLVGENRLPERRIARAKASYGTYLKWIKTLHQRAPVNWDNINPECIPLHYQAQTLVGLPAMAGNRLTLITSPDEIIYTLIASIDNAKSTCHLEYYIWEEGGRINLLANSLIRAAARGVTCRLLLDSIGSRDFLKSATARQMRTAGIKIQESLPAGIINALFSRIDIRNHRKLAVIDGTIAYTGSPNMVDPDIFKSDAGVGNWIDIMVRIEGPVVESLAGTFIGDWFLETGKGEYQPSPLIHDVEGVRKASDMKTLAISGDSAVQLVPSGPGLVPEAIHNLLLTTIYAARKELVLTTPYFIPDEPLLAALMAAAQRGVGVNIIVPRDNDSLLVKYASRARYEELVNAGVRIFLFHGGLLHSKTITVDGDFSLFGSVNLDMRSFWLNFEATLFVYCKVFTQELYAIQQSYLQQSEELNIELFSRRGNFEKFKENVTLLVSPLL